MQVLFENSHFIIIDKPSGWLSVRSRLGAEDPRLCAAVEVEKTHGRVFPVHQIDAEASGILLFARTAEAHRVSHLWFEKLQVNKVYEGWTETPTAEEPLHQLQALLNQEVRWVSKLAKGKKRAFRADYGREAETRASLLGEQMTPGTNDFATQKLWQWHLTPVTGRPHQLRFEMADRGWPLAGDKLYGAKQPFPFLALKAIILDLPVEAQGAWGLPARIEIPGWDWKTLIK